MTAQADEKEEGIISDLAEEAEAVLEKVNTKKELKEKRKILKQSLYDGSEKLKHVIPKGKHL